MKFFEIDGQQAPIEALQDFRQTYGTVTPYSDLRMVDGSALRLAGSAAGKISTELSANGYAPHGLNGIDWSGSMLLKCAHPRAVTGVSGSNVVTIPAARRSDTGYTPVGIALVGVYRRRVFSPATQTDTNEYTVTTVTDAVAYQVAYYPEITVLADLKDNGQFGWSLTAEEV